MLWSSIITFVNDFHFIHVYYEFIKAVITVRFPASYPERLEFFLLFFQFCLPLPRALLNQNIFILRHQISFHRGCATTELCVPELFQLHFLPRRFAIHHRFQICNIHLQHTHTWLYTERSHRHKRSARRLHHSRWHQSGIPRRSAFIDALFS